MPEKIKIGIFGAGSMARKHLEAYRALKNAKVVGVAGARLWNLKKIASEFDTEPYEESAVLLRKIDAADICLPTFLHESAVLAAADAGVHVICEKPIALDPRAAERMIDAARRARVTFMVAHCLRFWPEYTFLRQAAADRRFGSLLSFYGWRYTALPAWSSRGWLLDDSKSGGPIVDLHIHDADMALFLFGRPNAVRASEISTELVRSVASEFIYENGPSARADAGWFMSKIYPFSMGYRAVFEKAVLDYHSRNTPRLTLLLPGKTPANPRLAESDGYREELRYFLKCVGECSRPSVGSAEDALDSLRAALAARRAAASGKREKITF